MLDIYKKYNVSKETQSAIIAVQKKMKSKMKDMTVQGKERVNGIIKKMFYTGPKTQVILHIYTSILPLLKKICDDVSERESNGSSSE